MNWDHNGYMYDPPDSLCCKKRDAGQRYDMKPRGLDSQGQLEWS